MMERRRRRWSVRAVAGTAMLILVVAACVRLGFWQLDRLQQRRALNARIAARLDAPGLSGPASLPDTATAFYRRVQLRGRWDDPRSIVLPGRSFEGVPGVHLLTPLLVGAGEAVLVNRGWVPAPDAATIEIDSFPTSPPGAPPASVSGLVLPLPESVREPAATTDTAFRRIWYRMDLHALQAQFPYRLLPVQVQLLPETGAPPFPVRLQPPPLDEGPHLSYAIQWFSFAAIGLVGWIALIRRSRRDQAGDDEKDLLREPAGNAGTAC